MRKRTALAVAMTALVFMLVAGITPELRAQQKELPEVTILTAVPNFAFAAIWVAEQLKYFEQEGVRVKLTPAPSGSLCLNALVGRSTNFCASTSEGLVLARAEGAPAIAIQAHNRTMVKSVQECARPERPVKPEYTMLPDEQREVIALSHYAGLSFKEIADIMRARRPR